MRKQQGISLVELMVSITVGLILMTGVVQLFLSSRATFSTQQAIARVQETGRLAMEFLGQDIRMAGYMGCMSRNSGMNITNTLNNSGSLAYKFNVGIEGIDYDGTATTGYPGAAEKAVENTDMLVLRSANGNAVGVRRNNSSGQLFSEDTGVISDGCGTGQNSFSGMCIGDILVVADCKKARVFQATNLQQTGSPLGGNEINIVHSADSSVPGNQTPASWGGSSIDPDENFGPDSEIIKVNTSTYYIADNDQGTPTLYQRVNIALAQPLLEGVENMQLEYGRDTNNDDVPDNYADASSITTANAWADVMSVRVQLLVASTDDNVLQEPQEYAFPAGAAATPATDRRLRQVFINTIGIRSRLP